MRGGLKGESCYLNDFSPLSSQRLSINVFPLLRRVVNYNAFESDTCSIENYHDFYDNISIFPPSPDCFAKLLNCIISSLFECEYES